MDHFHQDNVSGLNLQTIDPWNISRKNLDSALKTGFFYCRIDDTVLNQVFRESKNYFTGETEKQSIPNTKQYQLDSYLTGPKIGYSRQKTKESYSYAYGNGIILYDTYCKYVSDISKQIMAFIDDSISLKKTFETLSLLRYFDKPSEEIGLHAHKDWGWLTFLATDSSGFQVFHQNKWVSIDPIPGHLIVNVGNALAWLNPSYHSPLHRVLHSKEKYSIVYFLEPHPTDTVGDQTYYEFIKQNSG